MKRLRVSRDNCPAVFRSALEAFDVDLMDDMRAHLEIRAGAMAAMFVGEAELLLGVKKERKRKRGKCVVIDCCDDGCLGAALLDVDWGVHGNVWARFGVH